MRIARVLHASTPHPIVALERDGALYDVAELERLFDAKLAPGDIPDASDFHTRVVALSCAGLDELDDRLLAGDRPTEARLPPRSFLWLPPCAHSRAMYVQLGERAPEIDGAPADAEPSSYWIGNARGLLGHDATVPFPAREDEPDFELCVAALLSDDLHRATYEEAERAILGYAILNCWTARQEERRSQGSGCGAARARDFGAQLGPVLVTKDEISDVASLRSQVRAGNEVVRCGAVGAGAFTLAESIAFVSNRLELHAGDIIGAGCVPGGSFTAQGRKLSYGVSVELTIERLGKLTGRPVRGPEPASWRAETGARRPPAG